jgi:predicted outer membrane lipoprotein
LGGVMPLWATIVLGGLLLACAFYVMSRPAA